MHKYNISYDVYEILINILKCESNKWYIGKTSRPLSSWNLEHFSQEGFQRTKKYSPSDIEKIVNNEDKYGIDNVLGGFYVALRLSLDQLKCLQQEMRQEQNLCFNCGKSGHFVKQ